MGGFLLRMLITSAGLWVAEAVVPRMEIRSLGTLLIAAFLVGLVNAVVRPVIILVTLPITVLSMGIFLLVINAAILWFVAWLLPGFVLGGFFPALVGSFIVSAISWLASRYVGS
jgi:putative membrane protein